MRVSPLRLLGVAGLVILGSHCQRIESQENPSPPVETAVSAGQSIPAAASAGISGETGEMESGAATATEAAFPSKARTKSQLGAGVITFMAYNVKNYLTMERGRRGESGPESPKPEREIAALLSMIEDVKPDILGVCEIGTLADLKDLQARLKAKGIDLPHAELCDGPDAYRNLGLLSKFPVIARDHQTNLSYQMAGTQFPYNRGILDATIEPAPGYQLRLLGTHLKSKRPVDDGDEAEMRRNEARLLRQHVEKVMAANPDTNLLVYGDLNDTKNTDVFKDLKGKEGRADHLYDLWLRDRFGFTWTHYWITADQYARIDYALYAKALAPEILRDDSYIHHAPEWFTASDHRPLVIRISPKDVKPR